MSIDNELIIPDRRKERFTRCAECVVNVMQAKRNEDTVRGDVIVVDGGPFDLHSEVEAGGSSGQESLRVWAKGVLGWALDEHARFIEER